MFFISGGANLSSKQKNTGFCCSLMTDAAAAAVRTLTGSECTDVSGSGPSVSMFRSGWIFCSDSRGDVMTANEATSERPPEREARKGP